MKKRLFFKLSLLFVAVLFLQNGFAQDYTRWGLPDGAKARLGKAGFLILRIRRMAPDSRSELASEFGSMMRTPVPNSPY